MLEVLAFYGVLSLLSDCCRVVHRLSLEPDRSRIVWFLENVRRSLAYEPTLPFTPAPHAEKASGE